MRTRIAIVALLVAALAGCAELSPRPAYVGEFTGEFVDGKPLYRFPAIEVVGRR
jgi:hypothetical protein